ncbi:MAG: homoserine dehydrogenase [Planctomycetes bacterium]|nr:homoserine dehydrogenase [Planctomycetota bacterium]
MGPRTVGVGLLGCGTVGGTLARTLQSDHERLLRETGLDFSLRRVVVRDADKSREGVPSTLLSTRWEDLLSPEIQVVVEVAGGAGPTFEILKRLIVGGKHIVTANKVVVSEHGDELLDLARRHRRWVGFEASVGAGVPVLHLVREALAGTPVSRVVGILNGTTNYILTRMEECSETQEAALRSAQRAGFAEADPSMDLDGVDAAQKAAILATLLTRQVVHGRDVPTEGIRQVTASDIASARRFQCSLRLLALITCEASDLEVRVHPCLVPSRHPLASVRDQQNAVWVESPLSGPLLLSGLGAGGGPTTSALLADLVDIGWHLGVFEDAAPPWESVGRLRLRPSGESVRRNYLRFAVADQAGVIGEVTTILGSHGISIESVHAGVEDGSSGEGTLEILTDDSRERDMADAVKACEALAQVLGPCRRIRCL